MSSNEEDFGFSAVNEIPKETVKETVPVDLEGVEAKLEAILIRLDAIERNISQPAWANAEPNEFVQARMKEVEDLVIPMLQGLAKNSDKAYIHWPNRKPLLEEKMKQIYKLTRS